MTQKPRWLWIPGWIVFVALLALDLWSKHLVSTRLIRGENKPIIKGFLNLTLVHNTGAAFGLGTHWSVPIFIVTSIVAVGVILYLFMKLDEYEWLSRWALVFILAGALGNLVDRIRTQYVVDFLDVFFRTHHWWTFNVADSCITVGAILFGLDILLKRRRNRSGG